MGARGDHTFCRLVTEAMAAQPETAEMEVIFRLIRDRAAVGGRLQAPAGTEVLCFGLEVEGVAPSPEVQPGLEGSHSLLLIMEGQAPALLVPLAYLESQAPRSPDQTRCRFSACRKLGIPPASWMRRFFLTLRTPHPAPAASCAI